MGHNTNCSALRGRYRCSYCQKSYMMEWAVKNHMKVCNYKEEEEDEKKK